MAKIYLSNKDMLEAIKEWRESPKYPQVTNRLGEMFLLLAKRITNHYFWRGYDRELKEDMVSEAVIHCIKYAHNFNPELSNNPFAYFSRFVFNAFKQVINKYYDEKSNSVEYYLMETDNIDYSDTYTDLLIYNNELNRKKREKKKVKKKPTNSLFEEV